MSDIIKLIHGDITQQSTEAIVNAANNSLAGGGGVDGAIHRAGGPIILQQCQNWVAQNGKLSTGDAMITDAGNMPCRYVIHTVGPVWRGGNNNEPQLLGNAWYNSLKLAADRGLDSISFPSISTGIYGYPIDLAAQTARQACNLFLQEFKIKEIRIVLFSNPDLNAYQSVF